MLLQRRLTLLAIKIGFAMSGCGGQQATPVPPPPPPTQPELSVLAGNPYGAGNVDGTGPAAAFQSPFGVATDSAGNLFVTDTLNNTIRKITPTGVVTTLAGTAGVVGNADGVGAAAQFNSPSGITIDGAGNLYVLGSGNQAIRSISAEGVVRTLPGTASGLGAGIAIDNSGNVYVTDALADEILEVMPSGAVTVFAGDGFGGNGDGQGTSAQFHEPRGLAIDRDGNLYVADWGNSAIRKITPAAVVTTIAHIESQVGIAVDIEGTVYVTETYSSSKIDKVTTGGVVTTLAGATGIVGDTDGTGAAARFNSPSTIATDSGGNAYVADTGNNAIRRITPSGTVTTFAGGSVAGYKDGAGAAAQFRSPYGLAVDSVGNVYVADFGNAAIRIITPEGNVTTDPNYLRPLTFMHPTTTARELLLTARESSTTSRLNPKSNKWGPCLPATPLRCAILPASRYRLLLTPMWIAPAPLMANIVTDAQGDTYYTGNQTINKVDRAGNVSVLAGAEGIAGNADGAGGNARFEQPWGIAIDALGNLYTTDAANNTIRRITPQGAVSTLAGTAKVTGSADGTGSAAQFDYPTGIALDSAGNIYVADTFNNAIRKITPAGVVRTVVGQANRMGFTSGMLPGALSHPIGLALFGGTL